MTAYIAKLHLFKILNNFYKCARGSKYSKSTPRRRGNFFYYSVKVGVSSTKSHAFIVYVFLYRLIDNHMRISYKAPPP